MSLLYSRVHEELIAHRNKGDLLDLGSVEVVPQGHLVPSRRRQRAGTSAGLELLEAENGERLDSPGTTVAKFPSQHRWRPQVGLAENPGPVPHCWINAAKSAVAKAILLLASWSAVQSALFV